MTKKFQGQQDAGVAVEGAIGSTTAANNNNAQDSSVDGSSSSSGDSQSNTRSSQKPGRFIESQSVYQFGLLLLPLLYFSMWVNRGVQRSPRPPRQQTEIPTSETRDQGPMEEPG
jgi:hypothetical protein